MLNHRTSNSEYGVRVEQGKAFILYLPTFPNSNASEIFVSILPKFPKNFRQLPNNYRRRLDEFQTLPKIPKDVPMISKDCRMSRYEHRRDLVRLSFRTQTRHLAPFTGLFWVETGFNGATTEFRATFLRLSLKWLCGSSVKENNLKSYRKTVNVRVYIDFRVYRTRKVHILLARRRSAARRLASRPRVYRTRKIYNLVAR